MEMIKKSLTDALVGKDLSGYRILLMTEVYRIDSDGRKSESFGFFKNADIATAFAESQKDANWYKTCTCLILTDGVDGYKIDEQSPVKLFDDEAEALAIRKKVLAKLSPSDRKILGFRD